VRKRREVPQVEIQKETPLRTFDSGATRDSDDAKFDYEGFLSPIALKRYARYMHKHRIQADGKLRASDNWQGGIPLDAYMKSMFRHFMDLWCVHRGYSAIDGADNHFVNRDEALCAILFNAFGYLHELIRPPKAGRVANHDPVVGDVEVPADHAHGE